MREEELEREKEKTELAKRLLDRLKPFGRWRESLLCEMIRMDATRRLIREREPELLKRRGKEASERIYQYMKEASERYRDYICRPFPGDREFFYSLFVIFERFSSLRDFIEVSSLELDLSIERLPREVYSKALEKTAGDGSLHIYPAGEFLEFFLECGDFICSREIRLYPEDDSLKRLLGYLVSDCPGAEIKEWPPEVRASDFVLGKFDGKNILSALEILPSLGKGGKLVAVLPMKILRLPEALPLRKEMLGMGIERIVFPVQRFPETHAIVVFNWEHPGEEVMVETCQGERKFPYHLLGEVSAWNPEILLFPDLKTLEKFFVYTPRITLGDVAAVEYFFWWSIDYRRACPVNRVIFSDDVVDGVIEVESLRGLPPEQEKELITAEAGDLIISQRKGRFRVGEVGPWEGKVFFAGPGIIIKPYRFLKRKYPFKFLRLFLESGLGKALLGSCLTSKVVHEMSEQALKKIPIPDVGEEEEINRLVSALDEERVQAEERARERKEKILENLLGWQR